MKPTFVLALTAAATTWIGGVMGCVTHPPGCDDLCDQALASMEECLPLWEREWAGIGYEDGEDYAGWCATFIDEQTELARARWGLPEGEQRLEDTCDEQMIVLTDGTCQAIADSWEIWNPYTDGGGAGAP